MIVDILTIFPEMFEGVLTHSMWGRAAQKGLIDVRMHDIRAHSTDKHRRTDDYPFGGGAGLVMTAQPIVDCVRAVEKSPHGKETTVGGAWMPTDAKEPAGSNEDQSAPSDEASASVAKETSKDARADCSRRIYLSPRGRVLDHAMAVELAKEPRLTLLCGHYEGVDQRALDICGFEEVSIGDYVLTGGELAAMVLLDAVMRHIPGVLGHENSTQEESHAAGLLEYPQYTRPAVFEDCAVPEVLLSGHHANIVRWRQEQMLEITRQNRPDLLETKSN